jgi:hypothetical protein
MNPYKLKNVYDYLTSSNQLLKKKLKLGTDEIPIPPKRDDVTTIEAINRFNKANPRVDTTNLKPLSVKHSNVRQSNVNEPNEGAIQSAFDTATRDAQFEGYPAPSYEKFKSRYLKKNMKAEGGRAGYEDGGMLVQPSDDGSRPGYAKDDKIVDGMENIFKEKKGPGKFRYFIKIKDKKYGQVIGEENLPDLKKKRDKLIKEKYPNRITDADFIKLKNLKKYENMSSVEFSKVLNEKGFTTISGKEWNPKSTIRKIDSLDLELPGRTRSIDDVFNIVKNLEGGSSKIKLYKEGIISEKQLRDIATDYEKRQTPEYKIIKKKIDTKSNLKRAQELGNFPPGSNPNDNLWAQVYRSSKDGDGRWRISSKLPKAKDGKIDWVKNGDWKKMKIIDTQTGTEFGYKDLKSYLDNLEGPGTYDEALKPWQNKKDLSSTKIKYKGNNVSLGKVLSNKKIEKEFFEKTGKFPKGVEVQEINNFFKKKYPYGKSSFAVNHPEGVKINWWKGEVVHADANNRLESLDKSFRASLNSAQNKTQRNKIIKLYGNDVKKIGNVTSVFEGETFGKSNILKATEDAFKKEGLSKTFQANQNVLKIFRSNKQKSITDAAIKTASIGGFDEKIKSYCGGKASGGRIGLQKGTDICPAATKDPEGFLKRLINDPQLSKFFKSPKAVAIAKNVARAGLSATNPLSFIGGEIFYVGLDAANSRGKGQDWDEALDNAFVFYDFERTEKKIMEKGKQQGFDANQLDLLQNTMNLYKLDNRQKAIESQLNIDINDPSELSSDLTMGAPQDLENVTNQLQLESDKYRSTLDKMGFDLSKNESYNTGFNYLNNIFRKKTQDDLTKVYDERKRKVDPEGSYIGDAIKPIFDMQSYTQPLKYGLDIINPFTKNVPFETDRAREQRYLNEMDEKELYLYNKRRGFDLDSLLDGTSPYIDKSAEYLGEGKDFLGKGLFQNFASGGIASLTDTIPPESGPTPHGLPYVYNNVKKI